MHLPKPWAHIINPDESGRCERRSRPAREQVLRLEDGGLRFGIGQRAGKDPLHRLRKGQLHDAQKFVVVRLLLAEVQRAREV